MSIVAALDKVLFFNASSKYSVLRMKTEDSSVPTEARSPYRYHDHLIRFTAVGIELPQTDIEASNDGCTLAAAYPYNPFLRKISPKNQLPCNQQPAADLFELVALTMLYNRFAHRQAQFDLLRRGIFQHACKFNRNADVWMNRNVASKQSVKINAQCCRYIHQ